MGIGSEHYSFMASTKHENLGVLNLILALGCVLGIATGQILFKLAARNWEMEQTLFGVRTLTVLSFAFALYGLTTIVWVWVLRKSELGRIYPLMSLAFILVPIGSAFFFGERFGSVYFIGVGFIVTGLFLTIRSSI